MKARYCALALIIVFALIFSLQVPQAAATVTFYVDQGQPDDTGDGLSWSTAKKTIQAALDACYGAGGGEVWVKEDTYDESITLKDGVALYGGFAGTETALSQRDWENNLTTIDGTGNYHVVIGENNATIDGFTITGGNANGSTTDEENGGGMYNSGVSPTVTNCTFDGNSADVRGGGMWNDTSVTVTNCTFSGNSATSSGGGICNWDGTSHTITNCTFINNTAIGGDGGGIYNQTYVSSTVTNCTFINNSAGYRGGGMWTYFAPNTSPVQVTNCTFSGNSAEQSGGGMWNNYSYVVVTNCILWGNTATGGGNEMYTGSPDYITISYSDINGCGGSGSWDTNLGTNGGGNIDADPLFVGGGDYHLQSGSPCIDAGTSDGALTEDFEGDARYDDPNTSNTGGGTYTYYDIGADEFILSDFYVDIANGTDDTSHGTSPGTGAWKTLHYAIGQINGLGSGTYILNVAAGTYNQTNGEIDSALTITQDNVTIQGAGAGYTFIEGRVDAGAWFSGIEVNASNVTVTGLELSNFVTSGIALSSGTGSVVEECDIHDNFSYGIYVYGTSPEVRKNTIYGNSSGIYVYGYNLNTSPIIVNNLIYNSTNGIEVLSVTSMGSASPLIYHNTIDGMGEGDGIYVLQDINPATPEIKYNIITNHFYGIRNLGGTPFIDYNDVLATDPINNYNGCSAGTNDISQDPAYVGGGDYHLQPGSPCIDAIPTTAGDPVEVDLEGNTRPTWSGLDMGAHEYQFFDSEPDGMDDHWELTYFGDLTHNGSADTDSDGLTDLEEFQNSTNPTDPDTDGDGYYDNEELTLGTDPTDNGDYPSYSPDTYYVDIVSGDDLIGDGSSTAPWKTVHHTIFRINGGTSGTYNVQVASGTYSIGNGEDDSLIIVSQDNVTIQGAVGAIVDGGGEPAAWFTGIKVEASNGTITGLEVHNFTEDGIYIYSGSGQIVENCDIHDNSANGISISNTSPEVRRNKIYDNPTGIYIEVSDGSSYSPQIINNVIYDTAAVMEYGIGVYATSTNSMASPAIYHNTIDGGSLDGIYFYEETTPTAHDIKYNIITNFAQYGINNDPSFPGNPVIEYNDLYGNTTGNYNNCLGTNDINSDPSYVGGGDYHFQSGSPCIDYIPTGDPPNDPVTEDLEGTTRPRGLGFDMGAYEYLAVTPSERAALIDLYNNTVGDSWSDSSGWKDGDLAPDGFAMPGTEGTWYGITCDSSENVIQISVGSNNCVNSIPSSLGDLTNLVILELHDNQLTGSIPAELGNLSHLEQLSVWGNQLTGDLPTELASLTSLTDGYSDFRWNALYTENTTLRDFLNTKQIGSDWESTQTIAPANLAAGTPTVNSVPLTWTAIAYTGDTGSYEVYYSDTSGGPYTLFETTDDKTVESSTVTSLSSGTTYYFIVRTVTDSHTYNQNKVYSEYTSEVSATTSTPLSPGTFYVDISQTSEGDGSESNPFKTLHHAIDQINNGSSGTYILNLAAGTYSVGVEENDEALTITHDTVTIQGDISGGTLIDGTDASTWSTGIEVTGSEVTLAHLEVTGFTFGIMVSSGTGAIITECTIYDNTSEGILLTSSISDATVYRCTLSYNGSMGIFASGSASTTISGCVISDNGASGYPGIGIEAGTDTQDLLITGCTVYWSGDTSYPQGTGIVFSATGTGCEVSTCAIYGHSAGISVWNSSPEITRNEISENTTGISVTGYSGTASPSIVNNLIYGTTMDYGIEVLADTSGAIASPTIYHNTIEGGAGDGITIEASLGGEAYPEIKYNLITSFSGSGITNSGGTLTIDYNDVYGNTTDNYGGELTDQTGTNGNISSDPLYASYELNPLSPCIDAIPSGALDPIEIDYAGYARPRDFGHDMGAYEYVPEITCECTLPGSTGKVTDYRMFTVPVELETGEALRDAMEDILGPYDKGIWRVFAWDPGSASYVEMDDPSFATFSVFPGRAFWGITTSHETVSFFGIPAPDGGYLKVPLSPGWNMVALPWPATSITIDHLAVSDGIATYWVTSTNNTLTHQYMWDYPGTSSSYTQLTTGDTLIPGVGYWIKVLTTTSLDLLIPKDDAEGYFEATSYRSSQGVSPTSETAEEPPPPPGVTVDFQSSSGGTTVSGSGGCFVGTLGEGKSMGE